MFYFCLFADRSLVLSCSLSPFLTLGRFFVKQHVFKFPYIYFYFRIPSSTPTVTTPSKYDRIKGQANQYQPYVLTEVNPQELANRLHGLPPNQIENSSAHQPVASQQFDHPIKNMHQGNYEYPQRQVSPYRLPASENPYASQRYGIPHDSIAKGHTEGQAYSSEQVHHVKLNNYISDKPMPNSSPPEKLQPNTLETNPNTEHHQTHDMGQSERKSKLKIKSKRSKSRERPTVDKATEMTVIEQIEDDTNDVDRVDNKPEEQTDETSEDNHSNVYVETNPR